MNDRRPLIDPYGWHTYCVCGHLGSERTGRCRLGRIVRKLVRMGGIDMYIGGGALLVIIIIILLIWVF